MIVHPVPYLLFIFPSSLQAREESNVQQLLKNSDWHHHHATVTLLKLLTCMMVSHTAPLEHDWIIVWMTSECMTPVKCRAIIMAYLVHCMHMHIKKITAVNDMNARDCLYALVHAKCLVHIIQKIFFWACMHAIHLINTLFNLGTDPPPPPFLGRRARGFITVITML